jgi:anti-sigma factor RsiW
LAELRASDRIAPWLEMELARQLSPVAAPESLWDRIQERPVQRRADGFRWELWPVAAALLLMASGGVIWQAGARDPLADMEKLAAQETRQFHGLDIRSEDPAEIRTWLKANANIDIALPGSGAVRLLGARLIPRRGAPVAVVAYRVGDNDATLLVSRKHSVFSGKAASKHVFSRIESAEGARFFSWRTREQIYTIASSMTKDPQGACLLCHANEPSPATFN